MAKLVAVPKTLLTKAVDRLKVRGQDTLAECLQELLRKSDPAENQLRVNTYLADFAKKSEFEE